MTAKCIVATLKIKPGKETDFEGVQAALRAEVMAKEKGCQHYEVYKQKDTPGTYVMVEKYASQADLDAHFTTEHMGRFGPQIGALLGDVPAIQYLEKFD